MHFHIAPLNRSHLVTHKGNNIFPVRLLLLAYEKIFLVDTVNGTVRGDTFLFTGEICDRWIPVQIRNYFIRDLASEPLRVCACRLRKPC